MIATFAIDGEIPGAIAYLNESIPKHKGLATDIIFFALLNGIVLSSLAHALLNSLLSQDQIISWGWRLPFIIALLFSALSAGFASGTIPCLLSDLFPTEVRYSEIAITYNIGFAVFGGLTPLIATTLIYFSGNVIAPRILLINDQRFDTGSDITLLIEYIHIVTYFLTRSIAAFLIFIHCYN